MVNASSPKTPRKRPVQIPTPESLYQAALFYLGRYAAPAAALRRVLDNKIRRAAVTHPDFAQDHERQSALRQAVENVVMRCAKSGLINDQDYAAMKVSTLRRAGRSRRAIAAKLQGKGLASDLVAATLDLHDDEGNAADVKAATIYARKRRLGSFRPAATRKDHYRKDTAALARAGFSHDVIRQVLGHDSADSGEE